MEEEDSDDDSDSDISDIGHEIGEYCLAVDKDNDEDNSRRQVCMAYLKDMNMI